MQKANQAVLLTLAAMLIVSCSNSTINNTAPAKLLKSDSHNLPPRIKITTNKTELSRYVTEISANPVTGFKTKAYSLPNLEFNPIVAINDPTDFDAHATNIEVLGISHEPGEATLQVMGQIAIAQNAVQVQSENLRISRKFLDDARTALKENKDPKNVPYLEENINNAETEVNANITEYQLKSDFLNNVKMQMQGAIQTDRSGIEFGYDKGTIYTAATFNAHYVEDGQIYSETENGYKQGYTLLIDNSDELRPVVVAKIGMSGAEFTMSFANGNNLYITGNDPSAPKNNNISKQAFIMKYDVTDPENPIYKGIQYLEGRNAVSIHSGANGNMIVATAQAGKLYEIDSNLGIVNESDTTKKDLRDAIWNGTGYMAIDGGFTDAAWGGSEIANQGTASATTGTAPINYTTLPLTGSLVMLVFDDIDLQWVPQAPGVLNWAGVPGAVQYIVNLTVNNPVANAEFPTGVTNLNINVGTSLTYNLAQKFNFDPPAGMTITYGISYKILADGPSLSSNTNTLGVFTNISGLAFSSGSDNIGQNGSNLAKASIAQIGNSNKYALGLSEGGIKIVNAGGTLLASAPIPGRTVNHVYVNPDPDENGNYTLVASAGYNGIEFFSFNPTNNSLQNVGSQALYERVTGGNIRLNGASTNGYNFKKYSHIVDSCGTELTYNVPVGMVANGVNGATYGIMNQKQVVSGTGLGHFSNKNVQNPTYGFQVSSDCTPPTTGNVTTVGDSLFANPYGVAIDDSGNLFVVDQSVHKIKKISSNGIVSTFAGTGYGFANGNGTNARFYYPNGITIDSSGNLYVADTNNNKIRKINPGGDVTTLAGSVSGFANGNGTLAKFNNPTGVAVDSSGNVYVVERNGRKIRRITSSGDVTTFAGSGGSGGFTAGNSYYTGFSNLTGIAVDLSGNLYVAEYGNNRILKITTGGIVSTLAGEITPGFANDNGTNARFSSPFGVTVDTSGNVYVADINNNRIRKINPAGDVTTLAGDGAPGYLDGNSSTARFWGPFGVTVDSSGNVFVADHNNHRIRKIEQN